MRRLRLVTKALLLVLLVVGLSGCPGFDVQTGDWIIHFGSFPKTINYGLTLFGDGVALPYEATLGQGVLPGNWTWQTDGFDIMFFQSANGRHFTYDGELLSETSATGHVFESGTTDVIDTWAAVRDPNQNP